MTLDMIIFLLTQSTTKRKPIKVENAAVLADKDGYIKGRDKDGQEIKAKWHGRSLVERIKAGEVVVDEEGNVKETRKGRRMRKREGGK